jgi:nitroreductase
MDVYEAIQKRRSVREYKPDPVPEDVLRRLLNAVRLAPSGANRQPWKFIVVTDPDIRAQLVPACWNQQFIAQAPVVVAGCGLEPGSQPAAEDTPEADRTSFATDVAIALTHLALAAVAEGLGTCWIGAFHEDQVKSVLGVPRNVAVVNLMTLGYPASWPEARPRKPLNEIVCRDRYNAE